MKITNKYNLPQPLVDAVSRDYKPTEKRYSVTTLNKGVRQTILERRHDQEIEQDVSEMIWALFGSAVHEILKSSQEGADELKEEYLTVELPNGYTLSGIFDLYNDKTGTVTDYKTLSVWKVKFGEKDPSEWDDYRTQVLAYCWMLRQLGFDAHTGRIVGFIKDHSKSKAKTEADYPPRPVYEKEWHFGDRDFEEIEARILQRFKELEAAEKLPDAELPLCTKKERWGSDDVYAVTKVGNKRAAKLFSDETAAKRDAMSRTEQTGNPHEVVLRPGVDKRCAEYCAAAPFCTHYLNMKKEA